MLEIIRATWTTGSKGTFLLFQEKPLFYFSNNVKPVNFPHNVCLFLFIRIEPANEFYDGDKDQDKDVDNIDV